MTQHNETFEPIDRSMPRVRITRSWPNAMMQTPADCSRTLPTFPNVMKTWPSVAAQRNSIRSPRPNRGPAFSASRTPLIARDDRSLAVSGPRPISGAGATSATSAAVRVTDSSRARRAFPCPAWSGSMPARYPKVYRIEMIGMMYCSHPVTRHAKAEMDRSQIEAIHGSAAGQRLAQRQPLPGSVYEIVTDLLLTHAFEP